MAPGASGVAEDATAGSIGAEAGGSKAPPSAPSAASEAAPDAIGGAPDASAREPAPADEPLTIAGRLDAERAGRSGEKPGVEEVWAAFKAAGLEVKEVRQGVARTSKARYCEYGSSPGGHRVFVCEFADAGEAERGATFMASQLVDPRRRVESRGRLALTVFVTTQTPESDRESRTYFETFVQVAGQAGTSPERSADQ